MPSDDHKFACVWTGLKNTEKCLYIMRRYCLDLDGSQLPGLFMQVGKTCVPSSQNLRVEVLKFCFFKSLEHNWNILKSEAFACMYMFMYIWGMEFSYCNTTAFNYLGSDSGISLGACEFQKGVGIEILQLTSNLIFFWFCHLDLHQEHWMVIFDGVESLWLLFAVLGFQTGQLFCIV